MNGMEKEDSTSLDAAHTNDHTIPNKRRKLGNGEPAMPLSTASALSALHGAAGGFTKSWFSKSHPDLEKQRTSGVAETGIHQLNGSEGIKSQDGAPRAQINYGKGNENGADTGSEDEDASALRSNKYERLWGTASQTLSSGTIVGDTAGYILPPGLDLPLGEIVAEDGELGEGGVIKLIKRGRGRPRKDGGITKSSKEVMLDTITNTIIKDDEGELAENKPRRKRGRPAKSARRQSKKSVEQGDNTEPIERHENPEIANSTLLDDSMEASESPAALSFPGLLSSLAGGAITILEQLANPSRSSEAVAFPAVDVRPFKRKVGRPRKQPVVEQHQVVEAPGTEDVDLHLNGVGDDDEPGTLGPRSTRSIRAKIHSEHLDSMTTTPSLSGSSTPPQFSAPTNGLDQENSHVVRQEIPDSQGSEGVHAAAVQKPAALNAPSKERKQSPKSGPFPGDENQRLASADTVGQNISSTNGRSSPTAPSDRMLLEQVSFGDLGAAPKRKRGRPRLLPDLASNGLHDPSWLSNSRDDNHVKVAVQPLEEQSAHHKIVFQELNAADGSGFDSRLDALKRVVLEKLTGKRRLPLKGLDEEYNKVAQLIEQTVSTGESNSMIITGARGSGKTTLVETAISQLSVEFRSDFYVIRLNGFVQTDDKLALREIWRQLGRELDPEDDTNGKAGNYADTLTSLLALLSHPSELSNYASGQDVRSVVFVLEEMDLFASHPRQTLLYNLFDICQARKAPIAVIGISSRVDLVDSLEKRVKSRFSHRKVHVALPLNRAIFWEICKEALTVSEEDIEKSSEQHMDIEAAVLCSDDGRKLLLKWSEMISDLYENSTIFQNHIERQFTTTRSVTGFFSSAILPIQSLSLSTLPLTGSSFAKHVPEAPDSKLDMLPALSDLSLALLIAAARLDEILESTCNFNMAYAEYSELASKMKAQSSAAGALAIGHGAKVWGKETAAKAWEALARLELIMPAVATGGGGGVTAKARMYRVDVALDEIEGSVGVHGLGGGMAKWCREI